MIKMAPIKIIKNLPTRKMKLMVLFLDGDQNYTFVAYSLNTTAATPIRWWINHH